MSLRGGEDEEIADDGDDDEGDDEAAAPNTLSAIEKVCTTIRFFVRVPGT